MNGGAPENKEWIAYTLSFYFESYSGSFAEGCYSEVWANEELWADARRENVQC